MLATVFDSLRRFRKLGGRIRLHIIQNYLSDGRLVRIVGQDGARALPLIKDKCVGEYDVVIDDAPTSPNQKEQNWVIISQMLPAFKDQLAANPELMVTIMEYSPLPSRVIQAMKDLLQKQQPQMQQNQNMQQAALTAKINKDQANAEFFLSQAKKQESTALYDMAVAQNQFKKSGHEAELFAAKTMHEQAKAQKAMQEVPENPGGEQAHERVMQAADQQHEAKQNVGQQRHELLMKLLELHHQRETEAMKQQHEAGLAQQQMQHDRGMQAQQQQADQSLANQQQRTDVAKTAIQGAMKVNSDASKNASGERVAAAGNQSKERIASAGNQSKERIASAGNQTQQNIASDKNQSAQTIAGMNNATQMAQTAMTAASPETES